LILFLDLTYIYMFFFINLLLQNYQAWYQKPGAVK